jgi:hypothetical protein
LSKNDGRPAIEEQREMVEERKTRPGLTWDWEGEKGG